MALFRRIPAHLRAALVVLALEMALFLAFRGVFHAMFRGAAGDLPEGAVRTAWFLGFKFDLRLALILVAPFVALPPLLRFIEVGSGVPLLGRICRPAAWTLAWPDPYRTPGSRKVWLGLLVAATEGIVLVYLVDLGHYDYLRERLGATLFEHVLSPDIAARMVWETYPVVPAIAALLAFAAGWAWLLARAAFRELAIDAPPLSPRGLGATIVATVLVFGGGIYGKVSFFPLRWSDAFFSTDPFVSALASNPVLYFVETLKFGKKDFNEGKVREHYDFMASYLGVTEPDRERLTFARRVTPARKLATDRPPNVVIVFLESFAAFKAGVFGNPLGATPEFDAIARRSILFRRFFVPRGPTGRAIFATLFGIPDVGPVESASRNPATVRQHTIVNAFEGYEKLYFIGGSASWAQIRGMLSHNIPGLRLYEEGMYRSPRSDVWGISDLHLLEEANEVLRGLDRPFVAFIQTAGNHRPYTIPKDRRGFEPAPMDDARAVEHGFQSAGDFNAMRFMDHSLGNFFRIASKERYFDDTIFVMYGDHGTRGAPRSARAWEELGLTGNQIPCVIHAPKLIPEPREVDRVTSSVSVLATVAGLAGVPYLNTTLGKDALALGPGEPSLAFLENGFRMAVLDDEFLFEIGSADAERLVRYRDPERATEDVRAAFPGKAAELERACRAFYETSRWMLHNNKPPGEGRGPVSPPIGK